VTPPGVEGEAKAVNSDLDAGIEKNLDAALITNRVNKGVKFDVKNGVVTLTQVRHGEEVFDLFWPCVTW
jgi:hypothetical protein